MIIFINSDSIVNVSVVKKLVGVNLFMIIVQK